MISTMFNAATLLCNSQKRHKNHFQFVRKRNFKSFLSVIRWVQSNFTPKITESWQLHMQKTLIYWYIFDCLTKINECPSNLIVAILKMRRKSSTKRVLNWCSWNVSLRLSFEVTQAQRCTYGNGNKSVWIERNWAYSPFMRIHIDILPY